MYMSICKILNEYKNSLGISCHVNNLYTKYSNNNKYWSLILFIN